MPDSSCQWMTVPPAARPQGRPVLSAPTAGERLARTESCPPTLAAPAAFGCTQRQRWGAPDLRSPAPPLRSAEDVVYWTPLVVASVVPGSS